jgi:hypothetical protein
MVGSCCSSAEVTQSAMNTGTSAPYLASGSMSVGMNGFQGPTSAAKKTPEAARKSIVWCT